MIKTYPSNVKIKPSESGLEKESVVKLNQIRTIDKMRLIRKLGEVGSSKMKTVSSSLMLSGGLPGCTFSRRIPPGVYGNRLKSGESYYEMLIISATSTTVKRQWILRDSFCLKLTDHMNIFKFFPWLSSCFQGPQAKDHSHSYCLRSYRRNQSTCPLAS